MPRLLQFLPVALLFDENPFLLVALKGRVERLTAAVVLSLRPLERFKAGWLCIRADEDHSAAAELMKRALAVAWEHSAECVYLGQTVDGESEAAVALRAGGFVADSTHQVYELDSAAMGKRLEAVYQRLSRAGYIPPDIEVTTLLPDVIPRVREFLLANLPPSASALAIETAGYKAEHSLALFWRGELKGVILCRRHGAAADIGLRVVAPELRGGVGWANLLLLRSSLASGLDTGLAISRFEFDPQQHHDTRQFAQISGARLVGERVLFRIDRVRSIANSGKCESFPRAREGRLQRSVQAWD